MREPCQLSTESGTIAQPGPAARAVENKRKRSSCAVHLLCLSWFPTQQETEAWWRERKKPKGLIFREDKGQGLSETHTEASQPGRWGTSRGSDTGLRITGDFEELQRQADISGEQH